MKKLLSFIWPQTTKIDSDFSGMLEITFVNGRKLLDSKNANYSFGSLQKVLETGISKIPLEQVSNILLLGLGGGSIIKSLTDRFNYKGKIHAVEWDKKIISIAKDEFNIQNSSTLTIIHSDATDYVTNCKYAYDLLIVDLFIDDEVPPQFYSVEFCIHLSNIITNQGHMLFNLGMNKTNDHTIAQVVNYFKQDRSFRCRLFENIQGANTLLWVNKHIDMASEM
jgi:spermidine synthase